MEIIKGLLTTVGVIKIFPTMKRRIVAFTLVAMSCICLVLAKDKKLDRVPEGKTYVFFNKKGKEIARYRGGQSTDREQRHCVQIDCPKMMGDTICWACEDDGAGNSLRKAH